MAFRDHSLDQEYGVAALRDVLRFAKPLVQAHEVLGVYIETKQPSWHESLALPLEPALVGLLDEEGWFELDPGAVVLQSFEPEVCPNSPPSELDEDLCLKSQPLNAASPCLHLKPHPESPLARDVV